MLWLSFGQWNSSHGSMFSAYRVYWEGYKWTPFVFMVPRYGPFARLYRNSRPADRLPKELVNKVDTELQEKAQHLRAIQNELNAAIQPVLCDTCVHARPHSTSGAMIWCGPDRRLVVKADVAKHNCGAYRKAETAP